MLTGEGGATDVGRFRRFGALWSHLSNAIAFPVSIALAVGVFLLRLWLLPVDRHVDIDLWVMLLELLAAIPVVVVLIGAWPSLYLVVLASLALSGCSADAAHWLRLVGYRGTDRLVPAEQDEMAYRVVRG